MRLESGDWRGLVYKWRGDAYYEKGELDMAIADYNDYLECYPNDDDAKEKFEHARQLRGY